MDTTTVVASYTAPNGSRVVAVKYQGREYVVSQTPKLTLTVRLGSTRITKKDHPNAWHVLAGAFFAEQDAQATATTEPRDRFVSVGVTVQLKLNTTGAWTDQQLVEFVQEQISDALCGIETMVPFAANGRPATVATTDLHIGYTGWDASDPA